MNRWLRAARVVVGVVALGYVGACAYLAVVQRQLIFVPERTVDQSPDRYGAPYRPVSLPSGGAVLHGWFLESPASTDPTILYLHGNFGNIAPNAEHAGRLRGFGFSVLLVDYRGYGNSEGGPPSERSVYEDAEAMLRHLTRSLGVPSAKIVLYGHSLGGAIAIELAQRHPELGGLIAESTFTSMVDEAASRPVLPWFPLRLLVTQRFASVSKVGKLQVPVLFLHGTQDEVVPSAMSRALFEATPGRKWLTLIPGGGHNNNAQVAPAEYRAAIDAFRAQIKLP